MAWGLSGVLAGFVRHHRDKVCEGEAYYKLMSNHKCLSGKVLGYPYCQKEDDPGRQTPLAHVKIRKATV